MPARYNHAARRGILRTGCFRWWSRRGDCGSHKGLLTAGRNPGDRTDPVCQPPGDAHYLPLGPRPSPRGRCFRWWSADGTGVGHDCGH